MIYSLLVSRASSRRPLHIAVVAEDEAEATALAWYDAGHTDRPIVKRRDARRWWATNGFSIVNVQVLT